MLSVLGYGNSQIILRGDKQTQELCCEVGKMILVFEDESQIEIFFDDNSKIWRINILNEGSSQHSLFKCTSEGTLFSSDIFSIESSLQGVQHIKQKDGVV